MDGDLRFLRLRSSSLLSKSTADKFPCPNTTTDFAMKQRTSWQLVSAILLATCIALVIILRKERFLYKEQIKFIETNYLNFPPLDEEIPEDTRFSRKILTRNEALIFVGGVPRSGTTLMRAMLDAHPEVRCGEETMIIPNILRMRQQWRVDFFNESTTAQDAMDHATSAFLLEMIANNGEMAPRLCNKDPFTAIHSVYLNSLFPNAKFLLMIRDARAIIHSMIERDVPVGGFDRGKPEQMLKQWDRIIRNMHKQCVFLRGTCLQVYYERLVQKPESEMRRILDFLGEDWNESVLKHDELIGKEIQLNPHEFSTSQVSEPVYLKALTSWFGSYSNETVGQMDEIAPFLKVLGYNTSDRPDYSVFGADDFYDKYPFSLAYF